MAFSFFFFLFSFFFSFFLFNSGIFGRNGGEGGRVIAHHITSHHIITHVFLAFDFLLLGGGVVYSEVPTGNILFLLRWCVVYDVFSVSFF